MIRRLALAILFGVALVATTGCYSADRSQFAAAMSDFTVTIYGGNGQAVRCFHSRGKVLTEEHSDGWYFTDRQSGKLIRVSGTVIIEQE